MSGDWLTAASLPHSPDAMMLMDLRSAIGEPIVTQKRQFCHFDFSRGCRSKLSAGFMAPWQDVEDLKIDTDKLT